MKTDASILVIDADGAHIAQQLRSQVPGVDVLAVTDPGRVPNDLSRFDGLMCLGRFLSDDLLERMSGLRWLQFLTSGTDQLAQLKPLPDRVRVTSAQGLHGPAVSEMALTHMFMLARNVAGLLAQQRAHAWQRRRQPLLHGKTVTIIGTGSIAQALATRCRALGMRTVGVSSSVRPVDGFDSVLSRSDLLQAAAQADFLVALVPLAADTRGLVDAKVFSAMKSSAYFINVARGPVCVEADLVVALEEGRIAGAGLDVFEVEPLPAEHRLWDMPNVTITPHIGGESDRYADVLLPLLATNLAAFARGDEQAMLNLKR